MDIEWIRTYCLSLPHTTEDVQWGNTLLFRIARKMYAVVALDPGSRGRLSFKCTVEDFAELVEQEDVIPAPYLARNHWVALTRLDALPRAEVRSRIGKSYELVRAKLPKKTQRELGG